MPKIYTKTGDDGTTGLWGGTRVSKSHARVAAYGEIDELNSFLGAVLASLPAAKMWAPLRKTLARVQEELFVAGALLAAADAASVRLSAPYDRGLPPDRASLLESEIDAMTKTLRPMKRFILPGGSAPGSWLHLARAACRRAERAAVALSDRESVPPGVVVYLNRLSDYLFTAARWANARARVPETEWLGLR